MIDHEREHWYWRREPSPPDRCVVVDVDGVISDGAHRQHFLEGPTKDWRGFFEAAADDGPIGDTIAMLELFDSALQIVLLTARPIDMRAITLPFLAEQRVRWDLLVMRDRGRGHLPSPEFKRSALGELVAFGYQPQLAIDDDPRNTAMFAEERVPVLYHHSGYYEA